MRLRRLLIFLLAMAAWPHPAGYGQINSPGARTLFARRWMYRSDWRVIRLSKLLAEGKEVADPLNREVDVLAWENFLVYGLPRQITAVSVLPLVTRSISLEGEGQRRSSRETGLADPVFLLQYDGLYRKNRPGGFTRLAGFFGVRAPWGQQPFSTEATALLQGLIFTHSTPRWFFNGDFQWLASTRTQGLKPGDVFQYDASAMYRLRTYPQHRDLFLVFEVNALSERRGDQNGVKVNDTGGNIVFLSPGIEFFLKPNLALEFSAQIPVHQDLRGTQLGRDFTLATGFRLVY
ncbi:MAG: transporter [Acidobacteria bacterium]|nr:transporter [Acidobacteriota bacterium]